MAHIVILGAGGIPMTFEIEMRETVISSTPSSHFVERHHTSIRRCGPKLHAPYKRQAQCCANA